MAYFHINKLAGVKLAWSPAEI